MGLKTAKGDEACFDADIEGKKASFKEAGIEYTINQIDEYRACGIDGHGHLRPGHVLPDVPQGVLDLHAQDLVEVRVGVGVHGQNGAVLLQTTATSWWTTRRGWSI